MQKVRISKVKKVNGQYVKGKIIGEFAKLSDYKNPIVENGERVGYLTPMKNGLTMITIDLIKGHAPIYTHYEYVN